MYNKYHQTRRSAELRAMIAAEVAQALDEAIAHEATEEGKAESAERMAWFNHSAQVTGEHVCTKCGESYSTSQCGC